MPPVHTTRLITELERGERRFHTLSPEQRQACVVFLQAEGVSTAKSAELLGCHERTVSRHRRAFQDTLRLEVAPDLMERLAGQLLHKVEAAEQRLRALRREASASARDKIDIESVIVSNFLQAIDRLQRLGALPDARRQGGTDQSTPFATEPPEFQQLQLVQIVIESLREHQGQDRAILTQLFQALGLPAPPESIPPEVIPPELIPPQVTPPDVVPQGVGAPEGESSGPVGGAAAATHRASTEPEGEVSR